MAEPNASRNAVVFDTVLYSKLILLCPDVDTITGIEGTGDVIPDMQTSGPKTAIECIRGCLSEVGIAERPPWGVRHDSGNPEMMGMQFPETDNSVHDG